jgi:hypothetical protein
MVDRVLYAPQQKDPGVGAMLCQGNYFPFPGVYIRYRACAGMNSLPVARKLHEQLSQAKKMNGKNI